MLTVLLVNHMNMLNPTVALPCFASVNVEGCEFLGAPAHEYFTLPLVTA